MKTKVLKRIMNESVLKPEIKKEYFGEMEDGSRVTLYNLINLNGMQVSITEYGGIITKIIVPDKYGNLGDVVLGFDNLKGYLNNNLYFGAIVGRHANRISRGKFKVNNFEYSLPINNGPNHLHGGIKGFDKVIWTATEINESNRIGLELSYVSNDGEEGYPGTMKIIVRYLLTEHNELNIEYKATSDKPTICNLTNHSYFNLKDVGNSSILDHQLMIDADNITPVDQVSIPTGEFLEVAGTSFDFRNTEIIGRKICEEHEQLRSQPSGYDHNFVLNGNPGEIRKVATVSEWSKGRILEVFTEEPGMQFYSGNYLDGTVSGKDGMVYKKFSGFCLETQHFPDAPNQPNFPSTILQPGEVYKTATIYKFSVIT